jgi:glycerate 2-kinase
VERAKLLRWFHAGVAAVDARQRVRAALSPQSVPPVWHLLAVGKAAADMAQGAVEAWPTGCAGGVVISPVGSKLPPTNEIRLCGSELARDSSVGSKLPPANETRLCGSELARDSSVGSKLPSTVATFIGAHPIPDERSLAAGAALLDYATQLATAERRDEPVLLLVSGGASALAEALKPGFTLADLQALTAAALADGADIVALNRRRRAVSRLKGGQLVEALGAQRVQAMLVSDVPGDDPLVIGSGLACGAEPATRPVRLHVLARLEDALDAMAAAAAADGCVLERLPGRFAGEASAVASQFVDECLRRGAGTGVLWGGESTVVLPPAPGRGGRNQHLALVAAIELAGQVERAAQEGSADPAHLLLLAAGTDGIDGNSEDAGALVDGDTVLRGEVGLGTTAAGALAAANSGAFLEASGDLVHTGRTATNVGDILVAWWPNAPRQGLT